MKRPRQSAARQNAGPLALFGFVVNVTASFFRQFSRHISTWEKELNRRRQTLKPLENQGFFRLSLLYRNGTVAQVFFYRVGLRSKMCRNGSFIRILLLRQIYTVILILSEKKLLRILWQIYLLNLLEKALGTVFFYSAFRGIKKEEPRLKSEALAGDPSGIRTPDTLIKSQVLCQLS